MNEANARRELDALTALRFFAALLVFVYHCTPTANFGSRYALGHSGVGFFFLLSGFILTYTYHRRFDGATAWGALREFYAARIARIYPVHLVAMVFAALVLWRFGGTTWDMSGAATRQLALVAQALLVQSWIPDEKIYLGINAPAWSISTEMFFYAVFPFVLRSLLRSFGRSAPLTIWIAAAMPWAIELAVALIPHRTAVWTAYVLPPIRLVDFIAGMLLGIAFLRSTAAPAAPAAARRSRVLSALATRSTALELFALGAIAFAIAISPHVTEALRYSLFLMPFWALLIAVFVHEAGALSRLLRWRPFVALGRASFAFYLIHWPIVAVVGGTLGWSRPVLGFAVALGLSLALSFALFHAVEEPMRKRLRTVLATPRRSSALPEAVPVAAA
ncbi:MAG TPA: acyltransferase [Candidatus Elarobacter sp.]|jgi:peptidoglycan/LPS O-acetylase OafA/YrhL|nr:acyltransferase [Candidatus Elarobacter sp.]